jgi:dTDP-4-amino-4,6-dideoxygalactose transaminase
MSVPLLDLKAQHATIRDEVVAALMAVIDAQAFILGDPVGQLECDVAGLSGTRYAVGCANGTDALLLALRALGVGRDDEVITTPFTFFATAGAIHNVGARPVFVDIDLARTTSIRRPSPRPSRRARRRSLPWICSVRWRRSRRSAPWPATCRSSRTPRRASGRVGGSTGDAWAMAGQAATIGTFSFFPSKNLGGWGDGGMMVTQDEALFEGLMKLRTHGSRRTYYHEIVGYNSRLDALQAAVLRAKLPHLAPWSAARRANAAFYDAAFADVPEIGTPFVDPRNESIFNQYTIRVSNGGTRCRRT